MDAEPDRVLIVDDNEVNRDLLAKRLQRQGYEVTVASNGFEALEILGSMSLDLVLLDIMMPQMNGYQVLETLKADPALRHIPVVMISAVNDIDSVVRCIELGAEDYLSKPFNPVLLKARIEKALGDKVSAKASAQKCIDMATGKNADYVTFANELIKSL